MGVAFYEGEIGRTRAEDWGDVSRRGWEAKRISVYLTIPMLRTVVTRTGCRPNHRTEWTMFCACFLRLPSSLLFPLG